MQESRLGWVAREQLAAWEAIAVDWPLREEVAVACCEVCDRGVVLLADNAGARYRYSPEQWLALIVLHLRNHHADLDPDG